MQKVARRMAACTSMSTYLKWALWYQTRIHNSMKEKFSANEEDRRTRKEASQFWLASFLKRIRRARIFRSLCFFDAEKGVIEVLGVRFTFDTRMVVVVFELALFLIDGESETRGWQMPSSATSTTQLDSCSGLLAFVSSR